VKIGKIHFKDDPHYYNKLQDSGIKDEEFNNLDEAASDEDMDEDENEEEESEDIEEDENEECGDNDECDVEETDQDDIVEFKNEEEEEETPEINEEKPQIKSLGLMKLMESLVPLLFKMNGEEVPEDMVKENPFDLLDDNDFDSEDPVCNHFKNDLGGCKGFSMTVKMKSPDAIEKFAELLQKLYTMRKAYRLKELREVFSCINSAKQGKSIARSQTIAVSKLHRLALDSGDIKEYNNLMSAKKAVLAGTYEKIDAAGFRVKNAFASYMPKTNVRLAYTQLREQNGEAFQVCPKALHQVGYGMPIQLSKCREDCIDSRVSKDGKTVCAFKEWIKISKKYFPSVVNDLLEVHNNPENKDHLLTLKKGERSNPVTYDENTYEGRMDKEGLHGKAPEEGIESQLDKAAEAQLGHHGEPKDSIQQVLEKTAKTIISKKANLINPDKIDTLGKQIEQGNDDVKGEDTIEEMLMGEDWGGFTEKEYEMLIEQLLEDKHTNKD
jgi:hypothetical protein